MSTPSDRFSTLLPTLAGLALVLVVIAAGARMLGLLPGEIGAFRDDRTIDVIAKGSAAGDIDAKPGSKSPARVSAIGRRRCPECGVIVSVRGLTATPSIERTAAQDTDAVNEPAGGFEYTVRLQGGAQRSIIDADPKRWRPGDRVIVIDGAGPAPP